MYYTVEDILDKKIVYGKIWYKVKWLGYSEQQSTWQPPYTLQFAKQLIYDYEECEGNSLDSKIFEDRDYGITQRDFYYENNQQKSSRRKKKNGNKLSQGKPCIEFQNIVTPSNQSQSLIPVKKQCKSEQSSNFQDNYGQQASSYSYNRYWPSSSCQSSSNVSMKEQIRILSRKAGKCSGNLVYIVQTGSRQIKQMSNIQLLKQYPVQFAKYLQDTLNRKKNK